MESHESTRQRTESLLSKTHEDRIVGKGFTSMTHHNFGAKVYPNATSDEDSGCNGLRGQGMEKARDNSSMGLGKSQEQKGGYSGSAKRQNESPLCFSDGHMSPQKNAGLEPKLQKYKGRVVLRGDIVKNDSGAFAVFTEQG